MAEIAGSGRPKTPAAFLSCRSRQRFLVAKNRPWPMPPSSSHASRQLTTKSIISFRFSVTIMVATMPATTVTHRGATRAPIFRRLAVKNTSGITAKGS